ncbi:MAG: hypothetical protein LAT68_02955 [Cyclobacteriaceae bacterium]|nr:hypothetical protein [Cyclobacteriaceae bacterium]MCH8515265.1 hypothetical protein [Cyclobacteriaceae bacterium]
MKSQLISQIINQLVFLFIFSYFLLGCSGSTTQNEVDEEIVSEILESDSYESKFEPLEDSSFNSASNQDSSDDGLVKILDSLFSPVDQLRHNFSMRVKMNSSTIDSLIVDYVTQFIDSLNSVSYRFHSQAYFIPIHNLALAMINKELTNEMVQLRMRMQSIGLKFTYIDELVGIWIGSDIFPAEMKANFGDPVDKQFFKLLVREYDVECCQDGAITLATEEIVSRAHAWGEMMEATRFNAYRNTVDEMFLMYSRLLIAGTEVSHPFDWETELYDQERVNAMQKLVVEHPYSVAANGFRPFLEMLEVEGYRKTSRIVSFIRQYDESFS